MNEYENTRRLIYGDGASFIPRCQTCGRIVKADAEMTFDYEGQPVGENATCSKCGRVQMIFEGYIE